MKAPLVERLRGLIPRRCRCGHLAYDHIDPYDEFSEGPCDQCSCTWYVTNRRTTVLFYLVRPFDWFCSTERKEVWWRAQSEEENQ